MGKYLVQVIALRWVHQHHPLWRSLGKHLGRTPNFGHFSHPLV